MLTVSPTAATVVVTYPADADGDGDVDLANCAEFLACMTGPAGGLAPECGCYDADEDDDVDQKDFAAFQEVFTGS